MKYLGPGLGNHGCGWEGCKGGQVAPPEDGGGHYDCPGPPGPCGYCVCGIPHDMAACGGQDWVTRAPVPLLARYQYEKEPWSA